MPKPISYFRRPLRLLRLVLNKRVFREIILWASPDNNPFLQRDLRRAIRRGAILGMARNTFFAIFVCNIGGWVAWQAVQSSSPDIKAQYPTSFDLPPCLGASPIAFCGLLAAFACYCTAAFSTMLSSPLKEEVLRATMDQLRLIPQPEERWLWMSRAYSVLQAVLIWCIGLPVFAAAMLWGQWPPLALPGLLVVFVSLSLTAPTYTPEIWQRATKPRKAKADEQKPGLDSETLPPPRQAHSAALKTRLSSTAKADAITPQNLNSESPQAQTESQATLNLFTTVLLAAKGSTLLFCPFALWIYATAPSDSWPSNLGFGDAISAYFTREIPADIMALGATFFFTLPYLLVRILLTPFPFFGFSFPPVVLWLVFTAAKHRDRMLALASVVAGGETEAGRRQHPRGWGMTKRLMVASFILCIAGYSWKFFIQEHFLASYLLGSAPTREWALATAWTLALVVGSLTARYRIKNVFQKNEASGSGSRGNWRQAFVELGRAHAYPISCYFLFCWLGGQSGVGQVWALRFPLTTLTALAFSLQAFGSNALKAALPKRLQPLWALADWAWCYLPLICVSIFAMKMMNIDSRFGLRQVPYIMLSPYATLALLFNQPPASSAAGLSIAWWAPLLQLAFAAICSGVAYLLTFPFAAAKASAINSFFEALLAPFRSLREVIRMIGRILLLIIAWLERSSSWLDRIELKYGEQIDNPLITERLRKRVREYHASSLLGVMLFLETMIALLVVLTCFSPRAIHVDGLQLVYGLLAALWIVLLLSSIGFTSLFTKDRINGNLVFLYLTPLTAAEILGGKLALGFLDGIMFLLTISAWLTISSIVALMQGNFSAIPISLCGLAMCFSMFLLQSSSNGYDCVRRLASDDPEGKKPVTNLKSSALPVGLVTSLPALFISVFVMMGSGALVLCAALLTASGCYLGLALHYWKCALRALERQRTGDVALSGKLLPT